MSENRVGWVKILSVSERLNNKTYYLCSCECDKTFISRRDHLDSVLNGTSKKFNCKECFLKYYKLPEGFTWKWIEGHLGKYAISESGVIWSVHTRKFLERITDSGGFIVVKLGKDAPTEKLHRLVANHFIQNSENKPFVCFKDNNKNNCSTENLYWSFADNSGLQGKIFTRLEVLEWDRKSKSKPMWRCKCECGNICFVNTNELVTGHTKSCGCYASEKITERNTTHGMTKSPEYKSWLSAKTRVSNLNAGAAEHYIKRGISMSEEWFNSFEQFYSDMGPKPDSSYSLERKDVNGDYCKENCIWETMEIQAYNQRRRKTNTSGRTGVYFIKGKWEARIKNKRLIRTDDYDLALFIREEAELTYYGFIKE